MLRSPIAACLACIVLAIAPFTARAGLACGGEGAGWFVLSTPLGSDLMRMPDSLPLGSVQQATPLGAAPALIAASDERVVLMYAVSQPEPAAEQRWVIRQVSPAPREIGGFAPPAPLPPLTVSGTPVEIAATNDAIAVIVERTPAEQDLWRFDAGQWTRTQWPSGVDPARPVHLTSIGGTLALWQNQRDNRAATLWRSGTSDSWRPTTLPPIAEGSRLTESRGQLIAVTREPDGSAICRLVLSASIAEIAHLPRAEGEQWIVPISRGLAVVQSDGRPLPRLSCRIISPVGVTLYDGPAITSSAVSGQALAMLAVLLASLFASALVFVFRPEDAARESVVLPPHTALAGPGLRLIAGAIDAAIGIAAGWALAATFGFDLETQGDSSINFGWEGLLVSLAVMVMLGALGESIWGRSIGKALAGCRVISTGGGRISWRQAFGRNIVRFLCPPLGLAWIMQTPGNSAYLFATMVIIDLEPPAREPPT